MLFCSIKKQGNRGKSMNEYDWYGIDNTAKIFPAISGTHTTSVYRIDARLNETVKPELLEKAVNTVLPSFPAFMVRLRQGLFWYYFEHNFEKASVDEEKGYPTNRIDTDANNDYLFRFSYFNNKINLDVFHALSDGLGAMNFLIAVVGCYLKLCGKPLDDFSNNIGNMQSYPAMQDSFAHYFSSVQVEKRKRIKAYHIKGTSRPLGSVKVIHGILETDSLKVLTKSKNVTVTAYLAAVLAYSILETMPGRKSANPVRLSVPINLRQFFESKTQRNFFAFIYIDIDVSQNEYTFDELLHLVSEQMIIRTKPEYFVPKVSYYLQAERNIFARLTPLIIKNLALRVIYKQAGEKTFTCTLSNLGEIKVMPSVGEYIERFDAIIESTMKTRMGCAICSYKNQLVVSFTKSDYETDLEKYFFRFLSGQGLKIILEQN